jgi:hypothetical protein
MTEEFTLHSPDINFRPPVEQETLRKQYLETYEKNALKRD